MGRLIAGMPAIYKWVDCWVCCCARVDTYVWRDKLGADLASVKLTLRIPMSLDFRYSELVSGLVSPLVSASLDLHGRVSAGLLPTPAKSHYAFNLRDLSKLFQVRQLVGV